MTWEPVLIAALGIVVVLLLLKNSKTEGVAAAQSREEFSRIRSELSESLRNQREEFNFTLKGVNDSLLNTLKSLGDSQRKEIEIFSGKIDKLVEVNHARAEELRVAVENRLKTLQDENSARLEQMRLTVDEKLQGTLEKRLGESFKLVSERLEQVYRGLGEMQNLAVGVGDLKRVLTNVKTRGTWGEVQLGSMLEQVLCADQYAANVSTKGENERVEYAVKLPGKGEEDTVLLPIDAKFPVEDYHRLIEAQESGAAQAVEVAAKQLEQTVRNCAQDISRKYLNPPKTTDFGVLFLPTEGLFAEVLRRPGLAESIQRDHRVVIAGPTTLWSILNSLQMGFKTLAIEKRSSEVWNLLAAVKTEWGKYGLVLDKIQKKLQEAQNTIDDASRRTRAIGRKLRDVEELPETEASSVLNLEMELFEEG
jgi:DNA recombination protein RmuC